MAQATKHLRDLLEKIKGDTERALALLPSVDRAGRMMNQFSLNYSEVGQLAPNHLVGPFRIADAAADGDVYNFPFIRTRLSGRSFAVM